MKGRGRLVAVGLAAAGLLADAHAQGEAPSVAQITQKVGMRSPTAQ